MAKRRRRETEQERALRERRERVELLKMKQGIIEESEAIPETGYVKVAKPRGWAAISNFFYHNKWTIFISAFALFVVTILVVQLVTREKADLYVLVVAIDEKSEMAWHTSGIESALERYCPDFDGNGKVHVTVDFIDLTSQNTLSQYDMAQEQKFTAEFSNADAQLIITDEKFFDRMFVKEGDALTPEKVFLDQTELCTEEMLFGSYGVRLNKTDCAKDANWTRCPDNVMILVRDEMNNGVANSKKTAVSRERAMIVLRNILDGNVVNPDITAE